MGHLNAKSNTDTLGNSKQCTHGSLCVSCKYSSPINIHILNSLLIDYPNKSSAKLLSEGFSSGFRLEYNGIREARDSPNLKSIKLNPSAAAAKMSKEISLGRIAGPFVSKPIDKLIVSPIGLVPKSEPGKFRLIQHLSFPHGSSINDGINPDYCKVKYSGFDTAIELVARIGPSALMAKADIESAFRLLPIHPEDFALLGIKVQGLYYVDKALPMGASCSPALFEQFSTFLEWAIKRVSRSESITHYADDFLFVGLPGNSQRTCLKIVHQFQQLCSEVGVPLAAEKSVGPTSQITYLGLQIDAVNQTISVPKGKLESVIDKVTKGLSSNKLTLRELQSLIGSLSFICKAVAPGRAFLRRLIDLTCGIKKHWHLIRVSFGAKEDLRMWLVFLQDFNGVSIFQDQMWLGGEDAKIFTDASGVIGFAGFLDGRWFQGHWPENVLGHSIAWKEFFPIVTAVCLWGQLLKGKRIILKCDNQAVVAILNKQTSKCSLVMKLLRFMVLQCLKFNLSVRAEYIPGKINNIADSLSRFQMSRFRLEAPQAASSPTAVPEFLWRL